MFSNRIWIAFANENRCDHISALNILGYCDWACSAKLQVGDIVYLYVCHVPNEPKRVRYKTIVTSTNNSRTDTEFWKQPVSSKKTSRLELLQEYDGNQLDEEKLKENGFVDFYGGSIKLLRDPLLSYIEQNFQ